MHNLDDVARLRKKLAVSDKLPPVPSKDQIVELRWLHWLRRQGRKLDPTIRDDKPPILVDVALHPAVRADAE